MSDNFVAFVHASPLDLLVECNPDDILFRGPSAFLFHRGNSDNFINAVTEWLGPFGVTLSVDLADELRVVSLSIGVYLVLGFHRDPYERFMVHMGYALWAHHRGYRMED